MRRIAGEPPGAGCVLGSGWALENTVFESNDGIVGRKADLRFGRSAASSTSRSPRVIDGSDAYDLSDGRPDLAVLATMISSFTATAFDFCFLFSVFFAFRSFLVFTEGIWPKSRDRGILNGLLSLSASYRVFSPKSMAQDADSPGWLAEEPVIECDFSLATLGMSASVFRRTDWLEEVSLELTLDLRRLRPFMAFLIRLAVDQEVVVSSDSSEELLEESEELFINSAKTPGCDSSSMIC